MSTPTDTRARWLSDTQQQVWRAWLMVTARLPMALGRQFSEHGLSSPDYQILVGLTDVPSGRRRVSDLAQGMAWERSRISHQVKRMEARGLVERVGCDSDARGAFVAITAQGRRLIEETAPEHASLVRDLVFDHLTEEELAALDAITRKVLDRLEQGPCRGVSVEDV